MALSDGRLALDDPAAKYLPSWRNDSRMSRITLRHLGSHTSGIDDAEADGLPRQTHGLEGGFLEAPSRARGSVHPGARSGAAPVRTGRADAIQQSRDRPADWCVTADARAASADIRSCCGTHPGRSGLPDAEMVGGLRTDPARWTACRCGAFIGAAALHPPAQRTRSRLMLRQGDWRPTPPRAEKGV
ncbi:MAG: serine hydrolase [Verrucomicrobiales bacterium]|nr:serine hydrolase [Verrucomicrobiales bacterium]